MKSETPSNWRGITLVITARGLGSGLDGLQLSDPTGFVLRHRVDPEETRLIAVLPTISV